MQFDASRLSKKNAAQGYSSSESEDEDDYDLPDADHTNDGFGDFNPRKKRRIGGNAKERAALGIFGSDSEDDGPRRKWKSKPLRSAGLNFVSKPAATGDEGEAPKANKPEYSDDDNNAGKNDDEGDDDNEEEEEEGGEEDIGVGLGFSGAGQGLGWATGQKDEDSDAEQENQPPLPFTSTNFNGSMPLGRGFVPSSANQPVLKVRDEDTPPAPKGPRPSAFSRGGGVAKGKASGSSMAARMMAKMGYVQGQGLGREQQGRHVVIEANLRPQGIGLGAVKEKTEQERQEEKRQAKLRGEVLVDSDEEEKKKKRKRAKQLAASGTSSGASTPQRWKTKYYTSLEAGQQTPTSYRIIDLTGQGGSRLLSSTSGLLTPKAGVVESPDVTEARKAAVEIESDFVALSEDLRNLEQRKAWVDKELPRRESEESDYIQQLENLQLFKSEVSGLSGATEWNQVVACLQKAAEMAPQYPKADEIAVAAIVPFLRDPSWDLLEEPTRYVVDLEELKGMLLKERQDEETMTCYESMISQYWFRKANNSINGWNVHDPTPMIKVIEAWNGMLPDFVRDQVIDAVVRKLHDAVKDWNPRKKRQSQNLPHLWVFPWLMYLADHHLDPSDKGTGLVSEVRRKFRQLIDVWEFERGLVPGLLQWRDVLGEKEWRRLIMSHMIPSMSRYLRNNFRVDPADQEPVLPILSGTLKWEEILGSEVLAEVLAAEQFPLWYGALLRWLSLGHEANLEEVAAWVEWWREEVFPKRIAKLLEPKFKKAEETIALTLRTA
jgi:tuftelin-interacting protein 11